MSPPPRCGRPVFPAMRNLHESIMFSRGAVRNHAKHIVFFLLRRRFQRRFCSTLAAPIIEKCPEPKVSAWFRTAPQESPLVFYIACLHTGERRLRAPRGSPREQSECSNRSCAPTIASALPLEQVNRSKAEPSGTSGAQRRRYVDVLGSLDAPLTPGVPGQYCGDIFML